MDVLSLEDALTKPTDTPVSVAVLVLKCGKIEVYTGKNNNVRKYMTVLIADNSAYAWLRTYLPKSEEVFTEGRSLLLQNCIRKCGDQQLWAVSTTRFSDWAPIHVPVSVRQDSEKPTTMKLTPLAEAVISSAPSNVQGKVLETSPVKLRRNGDLPMRFVRIVDSTTGPQVKVALFGEDAQRDYKRGEVLSISETYKWRDTNTLCTKKSSKLEFLPPDTVDVDSSVFPVLADPDFEEDQGSSHDPEAIKVMGIRTSHAYRSCPNKDCHNKKLQGQTCLKCNKEFVSLEQYYCSATVIVRRGTSFHDAKLFKDNIQKLFELPDLKKSANDNSFFRQKLLDQLPISAHAVFKDGVMSVTSTKRQHCD